MVWKIFKSGLGSGCIKKVICSLVKIPKNIYVWRMSQLTVTKMMNVCIWSNAPCTNIYWLYDSISWWYDKFYLYIYISLIVNVKTLLTGKTWPMSPFYCWQWVLRKKNKFSGDFHQSLEYLLPHPTLSEISANNVGKYLIFSSTTGCQQKTSIFSWL